jgi:integrase
MNSAVSALRFLFSVTLERPDLARRLTVVRRPRKLPLVLSAKEVALLLEAAPGPKYQAALATAYGAGLRVAEVAALKVGDVDSTRMLLRVDQGKAASGPRGFVPCRVSDADHRRCPLRHDRPASETLHTSRRGPEVQLADVRPLLARNLLDPGDRLVDRLLRCSRAQRRRVHSPIAAGRARAQNVFPLMERRPMVRTLDCSW